MDRVATRREAGVRFALSALATVAGLGAATIAVVAPSTTAAVGLLVASGVSTAALAARHLRLAARVLRVHSRSRGRLGPLIPSRRRAVAQLRRELDRLPETPDPTGR
jgi:hypothetical protein